MKSRTKNQEQKREVKKISLLGIEVSVAFASLLLFLFGATIFLAIESSSQGAQLIALERDAQLLEAENRQIEAQIVSQSSLAKVAGMIEELKMVKPEKIVYLNREQPVAQLP